MTKPNNNNKSEKKNKKIKIDKKNKKVKKEKKKRIEIDDINDKKFKKKYGFTKIVVLQLWSDLEHYNNSITEQDVLWTLDYLRYYSGFDDRASKYDISDRTLMTHVWKVIDTASKLQSLSQLVDRHKQPVKDLSVSGGQLFENPHLTLAVDTSFFPIKTKDDSFFNPKYSGKGLKYEFGCSLYDGEILWVNGPFKAPAADITIFRESLGKVLMEPGERFIGDKGYRGEEQKILTPHVEPTNRDMSPIEKLENAFVKRKRIIIENVFSVIKRFNCFKHKWNSSFLRHSNALTLIVHSYNLSIILERQRKKSVKRGTNKSEIPNDYEDEYDFIDKDLDEKETDINLHIIPNLKIKINKNIDGADQYDTGNSDDSDTDNSDNQSVESDD
ncbi:hypothetical protein ACTFIZ_002328 [Dictyostelium cf. discoideum]